MEKLRIKFKRLKRKGDAVLGHFIKWYNKHLAPRFFIQLAFGAGTSLGKRYAGDMAASIAYYAILSVFPLLLGMIALLGIFLPQQIVQEQIFSFFTEYLPDSLDLIETNINQIIAARGTLGVVSAVGVLWAGSMIFGSINRVINQVWGISQLNPLWLRKPRDIGMALVVGLFLFLSIMVSLQLSSLPITGFPVTGPLIDAINRGAAFLLAFVAFLALYKLMPNTKTYWRYVWPGALGAAVAFVATMGIFIFFVDKIADWELIYGQIGSVIGFLILVYISAFILIIGAGVSAEYSRMKQGLKRMPGCTCVTGRLSVGPVCRNKGLEEL